MGQEGHSERREADVMKNVWDRLFDRLSAGRFDVTATEEPMQASKNRKSKQNIYWDSRAKKSDKCWKTRTGVEIAWQKAAKVSANKPSQVLFR